MGGLSDSDRDSRLVAYHENRAREITEQWRDDMEKAGVKSSGDTPDSMNEAAWSRIAELHRGDATLDAASIDVIRTQQRGLASSLTLAFPSVPMGVMLPVTQRGQQIQPFPAELAGALTISKGIVEDPMLRLIRNLETSIATDTVRNEYTLHRTFHEWLSTGAVPVSTPGNRSHTDPRFAVIPRGQVHVFGQGVSAWWRSFSRKMDQTPTRERLPTPVDELNDRVYAELFLTPSSDPWLGLLAPDVYTALDNGGVVIQ